MTLWTATEAADASGGTATSDWAATGVSIDTRTLDAGDLFVALKDVRDGHDFVGNAFEEGAEGALVSRPVESGPTVQVAEVLPALENLGIAARDRAPNCFRSAVTGSVGKTSVKEMLARIYRALGPAHANERSFNNQWGVPLTLARMPRETQRAVFEIPLATFEAEQNLKRVDGAAYAATTSSGEADLTGGGQILANNLELSNADIADEFSKLIITQQAYSANSRIVTSADEMLDDALNMVR